MKKRVFYVAIFFVLSIAFISLNIDVRMDSVGVGLVAHFYEKPETPPIAKPVLVDDVIVSNPPPKSGVLCFDAEVKGGPYETIAVNYIMPMGATVELRDIVLKRDTGEWWILISADPPSWIRASALCKR